MADTSDFRNGFIMDLDNKLMQIVQFQHVKPGKGAAFVRTKLKNFETGQVVDKTFRSGEKVTEVRLESRDYQYLYRDGDLLHFMDTETYEQTQLPADMLSDVLPYLKENITVTMMLREGKPITVQPPNFVELAVTQTDPGLRGDTAQGGSKPATMETGLVVTVPLFIEEGEVLKIDTRSGEYVTRV